MRILLVTLLCVKLTCACRREEVKLENFDKTAWLQDSKGCKEKRLQLLPILEEQKQKLLGLSQEAVVELLGKPDRQDLQKRNAKRFLYYVSRGTQCQEHASKVEGIALIIQFGALNYVSEIYRNRY